MGCFGNGTGATSVDQIGRRTARFGGHTLCAVALALFAPGLVGAAAPNATVVEFYRADVDHYFVTASPQEQAALDDGRCRGWTRTGVTSVLNYNSNCGAVDTAISCAGLLATYAATGAYHGLVVPPPADLPGFRTRVQGFAVATYAPAVDTYLVTRLLPDAGVLDSLRNDTGIVQSLWRTSFNLDPAAFQTQLIPGTLIGRYDARVAAPVGSPLASRGYLSDTLVSDSFGNAIHGYSWPNAYVSGSNAIFDWDFSHDGHQLPDAVPDLAAALTLNPRLTVLSLNGHHDLATPAFQTASTWRASGFRRWSCATTTADT